MKFGAYANKLNKLIMIAKSGYDINQANDVAGDGKKLWNLVKKKNFVQISLNKMM